MPELCKIDLSRTDRYENYIIPDADVETCLKVLRSIRNMTLDTGCFDAESAIILSHAHRVIAEMVEELQTAERQA